MNEVRCFVALELPATLAQPLETACTTLRDEDHAWSDQKWVASEHRHVTLKFFGDIPEVDVDPLAKSLTRVFDAATAMDAPFTGVSAVPNLKRATMLWATFLDPEGAIGELVGKIERATAKFGVEPDARAFKPHITLVRARSPRALKQDALTASEQAFVAVPEFVSFDRATLLSSTLTRTGPVYEELASWQLPTPE